MDDHFGEEFVLFPVVRNTPLIPIDVNAPAHVAGAEFPFTGIFRDAPAVRSPDSRGHAASDSQSFSSGMVAVEFQKSALPLKPKRKDVIKRSGTGVLYEVSDAGEELHGRLRVKLTARS
jgi:hypothetical protein